MKKNPVIVDIDVVEEEEEEGDLVVKKKKSITKKKNGLVIENLTTTIKATERMQIKQLPNSNYASEPI